MSIPVSFSIPSNPGEELISSTKGPLSDCKMSTPQTPNCIAFAALNVNQAPIVHQGDAIFHISTKDNDNLELERESTDE